jgi:pimeloyl-ACP methyl ester carboxylesterase
VPSVELSTGITMHYEEAGSGEPVVLSYGAAGHHAPWEPQIPALSEHFRVITPDTRGTGKSDAHADEWTMELFARDLVALLDALGIERAHVGGMSMGSAVSQEVAIRFPERVKSLLLSNTWGRTDTRLRLIWGHILFLVDEAAKAPADAQQAWQDALYKLNVCLFFSSDALENRADLVERWWRLYSSGFREETGRGHWDATLAHDTLDRLGSISAPTLVLAGEEDYWPPYYPRLVHERIPGSRWELLTGPGSSHGLLWERAEEANAILTSFLLEHSA